MEESHLRDLVLLCDLCRCESPGKSHGISALSSAFRLRSLKTYFIFPALPLYSLQADLSLSVLLPPQPRR